MSLTVVFVIPKYVVLLVTASPSSRFISFKSSLDNLITITRLSDPVKPVMVTLFVGMIVLVLVSVYTLFDGTSMMSSILYNVICVKSNVLLSTASEKNKISVSLLRSR